MPKESTSNSSARQKKPSQVRTDTRRGHHVTLIHGLEANTLWQLRFIVWHTCNDCWGSFCATHTLGHFLQRKGNLVMIYCSLQDLQANLQPLWSHGMDSPPHCSTVLCFHISDSLRHSFRYSLGQCSVHWRHKRMQKASPLDPLEMKLQIVPVCNSSMISM